MIRSTAALLFLAVVATASAPKLPPGDSAAAQALETSPRHAEYVDILLREGEPPMRAYVVYPEVKDKAPVVIIIQEIYGLSPWLKSTADAFAAEGFIAIAPDLISGPLGPGTDKLASRDEITQAVRALKPPAVFDALDKTATYATSLPAATKKFATAGFCWGGTMSFNYAAHNPNLSAAVVYYGSNPSDEAVLQKITAPVLGLYGENDNRVNSTIPAADAAMKKLGKSYTHHTYPGAGHGFLRQQQGANGANLKATESAWPTTLAFLREHLSN
jgi:carboxymethylenebutenolidase